MIADTFICTVCNEVVKGTWYQNTCNACIGVAEVEQEPSNDLDRAILRLKGHCPECGGQDNRHKFSCSVWTDQRFFYGNTEDIQ